jgi:cyclophilin family peptidyl-prolyl cis-trans isomerase
MIALLTLLLLLGDLQAAPPRPAQSPAPPRPPAARPQPPADTYFVNTLLASELQNKQAVIETTMGTIVLDLLADAAPNHVAHFITRAREGAYDNTIFHRVIPNGIIQGGDPLSKDPAKAALYGTGGLGVLKAEFSAEPATRGAVAAVLQPNKPDSAGSQFFICVTDQPALNGKYTIFGRVSEGIDVAQKISEASADADGQPGERIVITDVTIRDAPPPEVEPFSTESAAELAQYRAILETPVGPITVAFFPDKAPEHVRNFLRLAQSGVFDGTAFHRVVRGFVIQTGALNTRGPLTEKQRKYVHTLKPEFSDTPHVKGILSMARGDDPASATTSFFIVTGNASSLDNKYTVFGRVVDGLPVVENIEQSPVNGEAPVTRIELTKVRIVRP